MGNPHGGRRTGYHFSAASGKRETGKQLAKVALHGKTVLADALHTQVESVPQVLFEGGGDHALTAKDNQKELAQTLATLLTEGTFSPSTHGADPRIEPGTESEPS